MKFSAMFLAVVLMCSCYGNRPVAVDPGVRGGSAGAGKPVAGLTPDQLRFFKDGAARFVHVEAVANGLGPGFNAESCGQCHSQPAIGGTSLALNPQLNAASDQMAANRLPFFILPDGPVREARFIRNLDGTLDGGVHDVFSIQGRTDAPGCTYPQPDFNAANAAHNLIFRIPTPVFGGGLIEAITDETLAANLASDAGAKIDAGIHGVLNRSGNTGNVTRFGWKAQNPSLLVFAMEAYNVEIGETNQGFPSKRGNPPVSCVYNPLPEDSTNVAGNPSDPVNVPADDDQFATFMRFLDQPRPAPATPQTLHGKTVFLTTGCGLCHTPSITTGESVYVPSLSNTDAELFSDLALHHMGKGLADGINQGNAGPDQFRTAPLWGVGQRLFFLHDGRTSDLGVAVRAHRSKHSEANKVTKKFEALSLDDQAAVLAFLRSL
jgi:CxxC motif-containing protein (DUF1111 family)